MTANTNSSGLCDSDKRCVTVRGVFFPVDQFEVIAFRKQQSNHTGLPEGASQPRYRRGGVSVVSDQCFCTGLEARFCVRGSEAVWNLHASPPNCLRSFQKVHTTPQKKFNTNKFGEEKKELEMVTCALVGIHIFSFSGSHIGFCSTEYINKLQNGNCWFLPKNFTRLRISQMEIDGG